MIAKLTGIVDSVSRDHAIIDVGGVGYLVRCSARTLGALPKSGGAVSLAVETQVREDEIHLYGFSAGGERDWFRLLTTVQGVGAKVALAILSTLSADDLSQAIMAQDKAMMSARRRRRPQTRQPHRQRAEGQSVERRLRADRADHGRDGLARRCRRRCRLRAGQSRLPPRRGDGRGRPRRAQARPERRGSRR